MLPALPQQVLSLSPSVQRCAKHLQMWLPARLARSVRLPMQQQGKEGSCSE